MRRLAIIIAALALTACAKPVPLAPPRIPPQIMESLIAVESGGSPNAIGRRGEIGLCQILPSTGRFLGYSRKELFDPVKNREAGEKYLLMMLDHCRGDMTCALAAYNRGPGHWRRGLNYARRVLRLKERLSASD
jgi:soluble lytic murein transglycosylase-like protein